MKSATVILRQRRPKAETLVNGVDEEETGRVADGIHDDGLTAEAFIADVTDEAEIDGMVAAIAARLGPVGVLVLNATGPQPTAPLAQVGWPEHAAQLDFFVKSPVLVGRAVLPAMRAEHYGRIVHVDSRWRTCRRPAARTTPPPRAPRRDPAGHFGTPGDVAHAVSFFASEGAGFVTGQRIVVDGGRSLGG